jgi:RNA polymerase sigma factor (sigma-70 family)
METRQFDSLSSYVSLAKKTISKFGPRFYNGLSAEMLQNEEAISDVATALMYADWRFDEKRVGKSGQKKTLYSYRNQCAIWAIQTYVTSKYKNKKHVSLDYKNNDDQKFDSLVPDCKQKDPLEVIIEKETEHNLSKDIESLLNHGSLSTKQKEQIIMYYFEDQTLSQIGKVYGVSREAVRQNIKRGLELLKKLDTCLV